MSISEVDRLAAEGVAITLTDGRALNLHYGFGGLRLIGKSVGGLEKLFEGLGNPGGPDFFDCLLHGIYAGLWKKGITETELEDLLDPAEQLVYMQALNEALMQAFPKQAREAMERAQADPSNSPGADGSISESGTTESPSKNSGE